MGGRIRRRDRPPMVRRARRRTVSAESGMKRLLRNIGELFALWIVVATILFLIVWLVLPQLLQVSAARGVWGT